MEQEGQLPAGLCEKRSKCLREDIGKLLPYNL